MNFRKPSATSRSVVRTAESAMRRFVIRIVVSALVIGGLFAVSSRSAVGSAATGDPVVAVGGDIACAPGKAPTATSCQQGKTGALLRSINPDYVLPLGDSQYDSGTSSEYAGSYDVTGWGTSKAASRPAAGNHEYRSTGATDYYRYFGSNAGDPAKGYYSWDVNGPNNSFRWHLIALNSECAVLGGGSISAGCGAGSTQEAWLRSDLAANKNVCTLAYWHRPRFSSSSTTPSSTTYTAFWNDLYNAGADIVLNGHAHDYERFDPQTGAGAADPNGLREFIVGTGGDNFQGMGPPLANSIVRNASAFGVMNLTLHANTYDWQFVAASGYTLSDSGSATCHAAPARDVKPPSAPTNVSGSAASPNQVNLSWTASSDDVGVTNYKIYRGANGATPALLATTTTNTASYTDTSVSASTTYTYQVQAIDAAGNVSAMSVPVATVTTPSSADATPPSAPSLLKAESVSYNEINLGWAGSTDETGGTGVSGYRVFRQGPGDTSYTLLATTSSTGAGSTSYIDTTVKPSSSYSYYVTAFDGANNVSGPSNTIAVATPAGPSSQTYTFTAAGDATITQASPTTTGGTTSPLIVDNSPVDDALIKFNVATTNCDTLTSAKLTLTNNSDGSVKGGDFYTTGPFNETTVSWSNAPTRGALLNSLGAVASNATVSVDVTQGTPLNGETDFRVGTASSDGVHYFSREGTGAKPTLTVVCTSAQVKDTTPPSAPKALTATAAASGELDLAWQGSTDNIAVTEYHIYRGGSQIGIVPATSLAYQDTTVSPSTTYSYTVRAFDAAGNSSGDSNTASATTPANSAPPAAPTNFTATPTSSTSVRLSWTASTSSTVTGYNIYRGPHGGALALIGSSGSSPAVDATASPGTTYDYAVTAVATGSPESTRSNVANVTTPGTGGGTGITAGTARVTQVTTASTTWTVNLPAFATGDFVVVWIGNNLGSTAGTPTSAGWTTQLMTNESSGLKGSFLTRQMAGGDPTSITVTWSASTSGVAEAVAFTGVNTATPLDAKGGQAEASTTALATHSTPSVTTTVQDVLVSGFTTDSASTWTSSGTEAGTELADSASGALSAGMYYTTPMAAGSHVQSATATTASVKAVSSMLALRPS
jgi:fibronectin type 3 domain-containing protein